MIHGTPKASVLVVYFSFSLLSRGPAGALLVSWLPVHPGTLSGKWSTLGRESESGFVGLIFFR